MNDNVYFKYLAFYHAYDSWSCFIYEYLFIKAYNLIQLSRLLFYFWISNYSWCCKHPIFIQEILKNVLDIFPLIIVVHVITKSQSTTVSKNFYLCQVICH